MSDWQSAYKWLAVQRVGRVTMVTFTERAIIDERSIKAIGDELIRLVENFGTRKLLLNFKELKSLGSYMLATLVDLHKKIEARRGRLALCSIIPEVREVFELTNLTKILNIYDDQSTAVNSFQ